MVILQSLPDGFFNVNISDVASAVLTFLLVILYWRMQRFQEIVASIQHKQTELMEKQANFMQANHQPLVEVEGIDAKDNTLHLSLTNRGNGPARNLLVQAVVYKQKDKVEDEAGEVRPGYQGEGSVIGSNWEHLWRDTTPVIEADGGDQYEGPMDGIESNESSSQFMSDISFTYTSIGAGSFEVDFSEMMQRISKEWDCDYIALDLHIAFLNIAREPRSVPAGACGNIPIKSDLSLEEALDDLQIGEPLGEPISEDEVASMVRMDSIEF